MSSLPILRARQLRRLLERDGWSIVRLSPHGYAMAKVVRGRTRVTTVPKRGDIPRGTLSAILNRKQTGLGRAGLEALIVKHGLS